MSMQEMQAAAERFAKIKRGLEVVRDRRAKLKQLALMARRAPVVQVSFEAPAQNGWDRGPTIYANMPMSVLVQQAHYEVQAAEREVVALGGTVPKAETW